MNKYPSPETLVPVLHPSTGTLSPGEMHPQKLGRRDHRSGARPYKGIGLGQLKVS